VSLTDDPPDCEVHHVVIRCRIIGLTDSESGAPFGEPMLALMANCMQQGRSVLDHLTSCFQAAQGIQTMPYLLPVAQAKTKAA
jgi:hypothetical protein